jgi:hypothetical protein
MITVGIHDNILLSEAKLNDKGSLVIQFKTSEDETNLMDMLNETSEDGSQADADQGFLFFPFNMTDWEGKNYDLKGISGQIQDFRGQLTHVLMQYLTEDQIKWNLYKDTGITQDNVATKLMDEGVLKIVYTNLATQFIEMAKPFFGNTDYLLRSLFIRQSKAKHFPAFRKRWLSTNPIFERMTVPKEQSRLAFSKWEKENGYDNPNKIEATPDATPEEAAANAEEFFKK